MDGDHNTAVVLHRGLWGILATPFSPHGEIDHTSLRRQVDLHLAAGSAGLVALGVFGEGSRLSLPERRAVLDTVRDAAQHLPVIIGMPETDVDALCRSAIALTDPTAGPTALMVQVSSGDTEELATRLHTIRVRTGAGLLVQDYPLLTGVTITANALAQAINATAGIIGVKSEAPPTSLAIAELTAHTSAPVFGGLGGVGLLDELAAGAAGAMTGFSHPEVLVRTVAAFHAQGFEAARSVIAPWLPLVNFEAQPGISLSLRKSLLRARGVLDCATVRPPALPMPDQLRPIMAQHLAAVSGLLDPPWRPDDA